MIERVVEKEQKETVVVKGELDGHRQKRWLSDWAERLESSEAPQVQDDNFSLHQSGSGNPTLYLSEGLESCNPCN